MAFGGVREWVRKRDNNLWVSIFLFIFSVAVAREAHRLGLGNLHSPGPGFMMFGASSLLGLLSFHLLLKFFMARESTQKSPWAGRRWGRLIAVFSALTIYVYLLNPIGYLLTTFSLMVFLLRILGSRRWVSIVGSAAFISFLTYVVFSLWFSLNFPKGVFRFF